jgi:hypothetical protein
LLFRDVEIFSFVSRLEHVHRKFVKCNETNLDPQSIAPPTTPGMTTE